MSSAPGILSRRWRLLWAMAQLVRSWGRLRIVAAVAYGLLLVFLVGGSTTNSWICRRCWSSRRKLLKQRGLDPHSFNGIQLAKKITELMGFNSSANSFAGLVVLLMTIGLGVAIQRIKDRDDPAWAVALAIVGAAGDLAVDLYAIEGGAGDAGAGRRAVCDFLEMAWADGSAIQAMVLDRRGDRALGIAAAVGHGVYHHGLPTDSLNFRWRYWVAGMRMFERHPLVGVGWDNFGPHYLRDRLPAASEEIRDPHNFHHAVFGGAGKRRVRADDWHGWGDCGGN